MTRLYVLLSLVVDDLSLGANSALDYRVVKVLRD